MKRRALIALALIVAASSSNASAQTIPPKHSVEDFAALPVLESPQLSPDGKSVAAKAAVNGKQYFVILSLTGAPPQLAPTEEDLNWWQWVNSEWLVVGIGGKVPSPAGDLYVRRAIGINVKGKTVQLSPRDAAQNGDLVIWTAHDGTPRILMAAQKSLYTDDPDFWTTVSEVDVSTGRRKDVAGPREGVLRWIADASGVVRMGFGRSVDGRSVRVLYRDKKDQGFREIVREGEHEDVVAPSVFLAQPGKALAFTEDEKGFDAIFEYDLEKLALGKKLYGSPGYDIGSAIMNKDGNALAGVSFREERARTLWLDPDLAKMAGEINERIKGGSAKIRSFSDDHQRALVFVGSADSAGAYFLYDRPSGSLSLLGYGNSALRLAKLHPVKTIRYEARDGLEIPAVLTLPTASGHNLPLIVLPHGGPFARDDESWDWWTQFLADRGYAVVQPNYRGSAGYGSEFSKRGEGQWGLSMQDDLNDAIAYLAKQGIVDPKRVCIAGASYGGYAALRAAQRDGALYRCAISYAGVSDLDALRRYDRNFLYAGKRADWLRSQAHDFKRVSPLFGAESFSIPVMIFHGKKDEVVPISQSRGMVDRLRKAGKSVVYFEQPEGDHHFTRFEDRLQFLKEMEAFLTKYNPA